MQSYPFTSRVTYDEHGNPLYDRAVDANFLRDYYKKDRCNGVIALGDSTAFQVVSNQGMTVNVKTGYCFINGAYGYEDEIREMQVQASDSLDRIDTVVLRLNDDVDVRAIDLYVVKGTPATTPTQPTLTRTSNVYELGLANLYIPANSSSITQERITDTRANTSRCGYSIPLQEIDTQHIYDQVQSDLAGFKANEEEDFVEWFDYMKDQLSEDAAGHLQNEIDGLQSDLVNVYGAKNLISYPYLETTKTVNGIIFTDNGDGTITANGTATAYTAFFCHNRLQTDANDLVVPNGKYILSGCPNGGSGSTYRMGINRTYNNVAVDYGWDYGNGFTVTLDGDDYSSTSVNVGIFIAIFKDVTVSNLTFYPMLRMASIKDDTYVPYVPTNKVLQSEVNDIHDVTGIAQELAVDYSKSVSHIGMIIQSTTLDTEEKVKSIYGGQQWISLSGYVLRGATSGVTPNNNAKDLGNDNATLVSHSHTVDSHRHYVSRQLLAESAGSHVHNAGTNKYFYMYTPGSGSDNIGITASTNFRATADTNSSGAHTHYISAHYTDYSAPGTDTQGSSATNANIPNEKNVYIWERVA